VWTKKTRHKNSLQVNDFGASESCRERTEIHTGERQIRKKPLGRGVPRVLTSHRNHITGEVVHKQKAKITTQLCLIELGQYSPHKKSKEQCEGPATAHRETGGPGGRSSGCMTEPTLERATSDLGRCNWGLLWLTLACPSWRGR